MKLRAPLDLSDMHIVTAPRTAWNVTISDVTEAMEHDPMAEDEAADPVEIESKRYYTMRGLTSYVDQFCLDLRQYMVYEHAQTSDEMYLRCLGQRPTDQDARIYEVYAYRQELPTA